MLRRLADAGALHHAWLITGPEGVGKATLAYRFARSLLAGFPLPGLAVRAEHDVFRQCAAGTCPDLIDISAVPGKVITIDDIRGVTQVLTRTPAHNGWRVIVIDGVHRLNGNASNALLKLLEEPPAKAMFILTTSVRAAVPDTLQSRCLQIRLNRLSKADLYLVLAPYVGAQDAAFIERLIDGADGSAGRAFALLGPDRVSEADRRLDVASGERETIDLARKRLANIVRSLKSVRDREDLDQVFDRWRDAILLADARRGFNLDEKHVVIEIDRGLSG